MAATLMACVKVGVIICGVLRDFIVKYARRYDLRSICTG